MVQLLMRKRDIKVLLIWYLPLHLFQKVLSSAKLTKILIKDLIIILSSLVLILKPFQKKINKGASLRKQTY